MYLNLNYAFDYFHIDDYPNSCQFPIGFSVAGSVRVGNALGAGDAEQAKLSAKICIACAGTSQCIDYLN